MERAGELLPRGYPSWRYCITVESRIPLTAEFVAQRIDMSSQSNSEETLRCCSLSPEWRQRRGVVEGLCNSGIEGGARFRSFRQSAVFR